MYPLSSSFTMPLLNWIFFGIIAASALFAFLGLFTPVYKIKEGDCQCFLWGPEKSSCHFTLDDLFCNAQKSRFRAMTAFGVFSFLGGLAAVAAALAVVFEKLSKSIVVLIICLVACFCCMITFAVTAALYNTEYEQDGVSCGQFSTVYKYSFSIAAFILSWIGFAAGGIGFFFLNRRSGFTAIN